MLNLSTRFRRLLRVLASQFGLTLGFTYARRLLLSTGSVLFSPDYILPDQPRGAMVFMSSASEGFDLLHNAIHSLRQSMNGQDIHVFVSPSDLSLAQTLLSEYRCEVSQIPSEGELEAHGHQSYSDSLFRTVAARKWSCIRDVLSKDEYHYVVYSDTDVAFFRDIESFISNAVRVFPLGFQSEARSTFPVQYCSGFGFFRRDALPFLDEVVRITKLNNRNPRAYDQVVLNEIVNANPELGVHILTLPEAVFPNGLQYSTFVGQAHSALIHRVEPMLFHANYVTGLSDKISLLRGVGGWYLPERSEGI